MKKTNHAMLVLSICVAGIVATALGEVIINPGDNIPDAVNANPEGTTFLLKAGVHYLHELNPKSNDVFRGEVSGDGELLTILTGARELSDWRKEGAFWVADVPELVIDHTVWQEKSEPVDDYACKYRQDLFRDGEFLREANTLSQLDAYFQSYFDYTAKKVYVYDDPSGHVMQVSLARYAFGGRADNIEIRDLVIDKYAGSLHTTGAIGGICGANDGGNDTNGNAWTIDGTEIRHCHGPAIFGSNSHGWIITYNYIHDCGNAGIEGYAMTNTLIEGNNIGYNGLAFKLNWFFEGGGAKFCGGTTSMVLRGNYTHHNWGPGLHVDGSAEDVLYEYNVSEFNTYGGPAILHEVNNQGTIRYNIGRYNGTGISFSGSHDVEVYNNIIIDVNVTAEFREQYPMVHRNGMDGGLEANAARWNYHMQNIYVHHNNINMSWEGRLCGISDITWDTLIKEKNLLFDYNAYHTPWGPENTHWLCVDPEPGWPLLECDFAGFQALGFEAHGTVDTELDTVITGWLCDTCTYKIWTPYYEGPMAVYAGGTNTRPLNAALRAMPRIDIQRLDDAIIVRTGAGCCTGYCIVNAAGRMVLKGKLGESTGGRIGITGLPAGVYVLRLQGVATSARQVIAILE